MVAPEPKTLPIVIEILVLAVVRLDIVLVIDPNSLGILGAVGDVGALSALGGLGLTGVLGAALRLDFCTPGVIVDPDDRAEDAIDAPDEDGSTAAIDMVEGLRGDCSFLDTTPEEATLRTTDGVLLAATELVIHKNTINTISTLCFFCSKKIMITAQTR